MLSRRTFLGASLTAGAASLMRRTPLWLPPDGAPAFITAERQRPVLPSGVQVGDVLANRAVLWSRADRPSHLHIEWATTEAFTNVRRLKGGVVRAEDDHIAHVDLSG